MTRRASLVLIVVAMLRGDVLSAQTDLSKNPIKPGEKSSVTLTVSGTTKPVPVRVRNDTPDIVSVEGGNDQVVMSSGGEKNTVKLQIVGLKPGKPSFSMELDNSAELDAMFRDVLTMVIDDTRKRTAALEPIRSVYKLNDVVAILHAIAAHVGEGLPNHEFAPFRDAIDDYVATLERKATKSAVEITSFDRRAIVVVSYQRIASTKGIDKETAHSILGEALALLENTKEKGRTRRICFRSEPSDYDVILTPRSYPPDKQTAHTTEALGVTVGKYNYEIPSRGKSIAVNGTLNFLVNPQSVVECRVPFKPGDPQGCKYGDGEARPCP